MKRRFKICSDQRLIYDIRGLLWINLCDLRMIFGSLEIDTQVFAD